MLIKQKLLKNRRQKNYMKSYSAMEFLILIMSEFVTLTNYIFNWKIHQISYLKILVTMGLTLLSKGGDWRIWDFFCVCSPLPLLVNRLMEKKQKLIRKFFIYLNKNTNYYMNLQKKTASTLVKCHLRCKGEKQ